MDNTWDCVVVGAGAAGLSAALVLGRARRRTLVVDAGAQSNRVAHGIGGLLGHDGRPPAELYAAGRRELAAYPSVEVRSGTILGATGAGDDFTLELDDGTRVATRRILLATGMEYRFPPVDGIAALWGRSVFHCPFCHGWEVRERPLAVLDRGETAVMRAQLLRAWSDEVTLLSNGSAELDAEQTATLAAAGVQVDEREVVGLIGAGDELEGVRFADGSERAVGGLLVAVTLHQRSALADQLGVAASPPGHVAADAIAVDPRFQTNVPGVFAAGDASSQMPSVANAVAAGSNAAAAIVHSLVIA